MEIVRFIIGLVLMLILGILLPIYRGLEMLEDYFKKQQWPGSFIFRWIVYIVSIPFAIITKIIDSAHLGH